MRSRRASEIWPGRFSTAPLNDTTGQTATRVRLVEAAWEVEQIGPEAWPALWDLVMDGGPECEYFLGAVVRLEGVDPQARRKALLTAARNPHPDVRSRLLELLEEMPDELRAEVLRELTADGRPDDGVTERAREV